MPDKEVKFCYDCGTVFTTFKRRHHCRICGQIFCWKYVHDHVLFSPLRCTQNTIKLPNEVTVRVCNSCFRMHSSKQVERLEPAASMKFSPYRNIHGPGATSALDLKKPNSNRDSLPENFLSSSYKPMEMHLSADVSFDDDEKEIT